jgi:tetratricopeptide (TPR) repeat protein
MLETIRDFGLERLEGCGVGAAARRRHLGWCLGLAEEAEPHLTGPDQDRWLARLEAEHANVRAALGWALAGGSAATPCGAAPAEGLRLAGALWRFWFTRGYLSEGRRWLEGALAGEGRSEEARAKALHGAGILAWRQGDYAQAAALHEEALALRREMGDTQGVAASLNNLGLVAGEQGEYERARTLYEESLALQRTLGHKQGIANALNNLGILATRLGDYARATELYEESLGLQRALGHKQGVGAVLGNLGRVAERQGDYGRAASLIEEALAFARDLGDTREIALSLRSLGAVARLQADYERAASLLTESLALSRDIGARDLMADGLTLLAWVALARGQPGRAARLGGAAQALWDAIGAPLLPYQRASHDQAVAAMRAALGDALFAASWAAGMALSPEQALDEALAAPRPSRD